MKVGYIGFDPTSDSLHIGSLVQLIILKHFQNYGHKPIVLIGGATGMIGDPSGKSKERNLLSQEIIDQNIKSLHVQFSKFLNFDDSDNSALILNNFDWNNELNIIEFFRDFGKALTVNYMMSKDSVKKRLGSDSSDGMSFTEFTYQLFQAYDFYYLNEKYDCSIQMGGSDQWGNITSGVELIRKKSGKKANAMTCPLITKVDGTKFGKSASGAVWLSKEKLTPYHFYQYLLNTSDSDVITLLRMLTFLPLDHIERIEQDMSTASYIPNTAQQILATEVTRFVHGSDGLQEATKATASLRPGTDTVLDADALKLVSDTIPSATLSRSDVIDKPIVDVVASSGLLESKGAAKRMIRNGGIRVNNMKITDESKTISQSDIVGDNMVLLAAGKKNKLLLMLQ